MADPVNSIINWLKGLLTSWGMGEGWVTFVMYMVGILALMIFLLVLDIFLVWVERKVVARFQDRIGPNRLGPYGLIQPIADVIKLVIKEDITPKGADRFIYNLPPIIALATVLMLWAVIPLQPTVVGANLDPGILYIIALGAISTLGIIMAGWASNNKYSLLGAMRAVAQMIAYEIPMVISILVPVLLSRSMNVRVIVENQSVWYVVVAPVAFLIFLISAIAELGRAPFDLPEAESELVAGFHTEYSGMKFGMFYAGELLHALTMGALVSTLFFGGWRGPWAQEVPLLGVIWLLVKSFFFYWVIMWIKYSLPRFRMDQVLDLNWKVLVPLSLISLMVTAFTDKLLVGYSPVIHVLGLIFVNLLMIWGVLTILRKRAQIERKRVAEPKPFASPDNAELRVAGKSSAATTITQ